MSASMHVHLNKRAMCAISLQIQQLRNLDTLSRYKRNTFRNTECNFAWCHYAVMRDKAARDVHAPRAASVDGRRIAHVLPYELFCVPAGDNIEILHRWIISIEKKPCRFHQLVDPFERNSKGNIYSRERKMFTFSFVCLCYVYNGASMIDDTRST